MDLIGYIGGILLAFCAAPEAYLAWKRGHSSLSWGFLSLWGVGEVFTLAAVLTDAPLGYLLLNYGLNILFISIICYYKRKGDKNV